MEGGQAGRNAEAIKGFERIPLVYDSLNLGRNASDPFLSFPPEVPANDHPFYKYVLLRLMPIEGGAARVIAYVYGGQGTINVPSWSPDGKRLAFVSNSVIR